MNTRLQMRRDALNNWQRENPILLDGEIGFIKDTIYSHVNQMVIGDGIHPFKELPIISLELKPQKEYYKCHWTTTVISQECVIDTDNYFIF